MIVREGYRALLAKYEGLTVVATAASHVYRIVQEGLTNIRGDGLWKVEDGGPKVRGSRRRMRAYRHRCRRQRRAIAFGRRVGPAWPSGVPGRGTQCVELS